MGSGLHTGHGEHPDCSWLEHEVNHGEPWEQTFAQVMLWVCFVASLGLFLWYIWLKYTSTCGWEVIYVAGVELVTYLCEIFLEYRSPASLYLHNGSYALWLRYAEWLLSCPVLLIHLSNLSGCKDDYSARTMVLLVSDLGCIVFGISSALAKEAWLKGILFAIGMVYGVLTYINAAHVYQEAYYTVPEGLCRRIVVWLAWIYFTSWLSFPILFVLGPEAFGHLSTSGSVISHCFADLAAKNLWGFLGHLLRHKVHEHLLVHGDVRKKIRIELGGHVKEIEAFASEEDEGAYRLPSAHLARRRSFVLMRQQMQNRGISVRKSVDGGPGAYGDADPESPTKAPGLPLLKHMHTQQLSSPTKVALQPASSGFAKGKNLQRRLVLQDLDKGVVVLGTDNPADVQAFMGGFAQLGLTMQIISCPSISSVETMAEQLAQSGQPARCVLLSPAVLEQDEGYAVVSKLQKALGAIVVGYGWAPGCELLEHAPLDEYLEGPSPGTEFRLHRLAAALLRHSSATAAASKQPSSAGQPGGALAAAPARQGSQMAALVAAAGFGPAAPKRASVNSEDSIHSGQIFAVAAPASFEMVPPGKARHAVASKSNQIQQGMVGIAQSGQLEGAKAVMAAGAQGLGHIKCYTNAAATTEEDDDWMTATTEDAAYQDLSTKALHSAFYSATNPLASGPTASKPTGAPPSPARGRGSYASMAHQSGAKSGAAPRTSSPRRRSSHIPGTADAAHPASGASGPAAVLLPADIPLRLQAAINSVTSFTKPELKKALANIYGRESSGAEELQRLASTLIPSSDNSTKAKALDNLATYLAVVLPLAWQNVN